MPGKARPAPQAHCAPACPPISSFTSAAFQLKMPVKKRSKAPGVREKVLSWGLPAAWVTIVVAALLCTGGNESLPYTQLHNQLAEITVHLARLAFFLGLCVVIEQPLSSALFEWWPMAKAMLEIGASRGQVWLDGFGASSMKPLQLWGNAPWLAALQRRSKEAHKFAQPTEQLSISTTNALGRKSVTGKRRAMKESSAYPLEFGEEVGYLHARTMPVDKAPAMAPGRLFGLGLHSD